MRTFFGSLVLLATLAAGCATTEFKSTWKNPTVGPVDFTGKKVVALLITSEEPVRREVEDTLVAELLKRGVDGVPGYSLVSMEDSKDRTKARKLLEESGADGVIVLRVVDRKQETRYIPGSYSSSMYSSIWSYHDYGWGSVYNPGYTMIYTLVSVETLCYQLPEGKLLWAGTSETFSPKSAAALVKDLVAEASRVMKTQGLVAR